jgi:hypothetical protein
MARHTFNFTVFDPNADWMSQWVAANPLGSAAWNGRWTAGAVDFGNDAGLYTYYQDNPVQESPEDLWPLYRRTVPFNDGDGQMWDWNAQFYYDPLTGFHTVGGGVGTSPAYPDAKYKTWYIRYDPRINKWYKRQDPLGSGQGHHYNQNAMDVVGRKYYRMFSQFNLDDTTPIGHPNNAPYVTISGVPNWNPSGPSSMAVHEELGRVYYFASGNAQEVGANRGQYMYWTPSPRNGSTGTWSAILYSGAGIGNHPVACYHAGLKTIVFGGGNEVIGSGQGNPLFKIGPTGVVTRIDDVPLNLGIQAVKASSPSAMIFDVGLPDAFVVIFDPGTRPPVHPENKIYLWKPNAPSGSQWVVSQDTFAPYMLDWTGFRTTAGFAMSHLGMIVLMRCKESEPQTSLNPDLAERHSAVFFYKPSGN